MDDQLQRLKDELLAQGAVDASASAPIDRFSSLKSLVQPKLQEKIQDQDMLETLRNSAIGESEIRGSNAEELHQKTHEPRAPGGTITIPSDSSVDTSAPTIDLSKARQIEESFNRGPANTNNFETLKKLFGK